MELDLPIDSISLRFSAELIRHTRDEFGTKKTFLLVPLLLSLSVDTENPWKTNGNESSGVSEMCS